MSEQDYSLPEWFGGNLRTSCTLTWNLFPQLRFALIQPNATACLSLWFCNGWCKCRSRGGVGAGCWCWVLPLLMDIHALPTATRLRCHSILLGVLWLNPPHHSSRSRLPLRSFPSLCCWCSRPSCWYYLLLISISSFHCIMTSDQQHNHYRQHWAIPVLAPSHQGNHGCYEGPGGKLRPPK